MRSVEVLIVLAVVVYLVVGFCYWWFWALTIGGNDTFGMLLACALLWPLFLLFHAVDELFRR